MPDWDACANRHLLAHILKAARYRHYYLAPEDVGRGALANPAPTSLRQAQILRSYAHRWALDMQDWPTYPPSAAEQREAWGKAMQMADRDCQRVRTTVTGVTEVTREDHEAINELSDDIPPR